jgi:hypothetical protein
MCSSEDERLRLQAAEFVGNRLLPKRKAVEHSGELHHEATLIVHRYGRAPPGHE